MIVTREPFYANTSKGVAGTESVVTAYLQRGGTTVDVGVDLLRHNDKCFSVKCVGPNPVNAGLIETTNIPAEQRNPNDWETIDSTTFAFLSAGSVKSRQFTNDSRRYWRVRLFSTNGTVASPQVTAR